MSRFALAAVVCQLDCAESFAECRVKAAGADRGQLLRVTDEDRLPLGPLDVLEQWCEHTRLGHPGLVDDEHTAAW